MNRRRRRAVLAAIILSAAATVVPAPLAGATGTTAQTLPSFGGGYNLATDVNEGGVIVGTSSDTSSQHRAYRYDPVSNTILDLGDLGGGASQAYGINDAGTIVGCSFLPSSSTQRPFRWDPVSETLLDLGTFGGGLGCARDVNDTGIVVGCSTDADGDRRAFRWDPGSESLLDIGDLGGDEACAHAVNDAGVIVGCSENAAGDEVPFRWDPESESMLDLGTFGDDEYGGCAYDINDAGTIVGRTGGTTPGTDSPTPFLWDPATESLVDLGVSGYFKGEARGINDAGVVVGTTSHRTSPPYPAEQRAFRWDPDTETHTLLALPAGADSAAANAISDAGIIVGERGSGQASIRWTEGSSHQFSDVPPTHPFSLEINWLVAQGITDGYPDGSFRPTAAVTRQAMAAFLYRLAGSPNGPSPTCTTSTFTDVPTSHPFCGSIAWLVAQGITTGYPDGTFRPTSTVTRQSMAAFLYRYDLLVT